MSPRFRKEQWYQESTAIKYNYATSNHIHWKQEYSEPVQNKVRVYTPLELLDQAIEAVCALARNPLSFPGTN